MIDPLNHVEWEPPGDDPGEEPRDDDLGEERGGDGPIIVWLPEHHAWVFALPEYPGEDLIVVCPIADLREWLAARRRRFVRPDFYGDGRVLLLAWPLLIGRN